jgi:hypothetical protein
MLSNAQSPEARCYDHFDKLIRKHNDRHSDKAERLRPRLTAFAGKKLIGAAPRRSQCRPQFHQPHAAGLFIVQRKSTSGALSSLIAACCRRSINQFLARRFVSAPACTYINSAKSLKIETACQSKSVMMVRLNGPTGWKVQ